LVCPFEIDTMDFGSLPQIKLRKLSRIKLNKSNPRFIREDMFKKLKKSLQEFPQGLKYRPLIIDDKGVVQGGNMRLRAARELKWDEIPTINAKDLPPDELRRLIIVDNIGFGAWDYEMLANEWEPQELGDWGLTVFDLEPVDLGAFFEDKEDDDDEGKMRLTLLFPGSEREKIEKALDASGMTKEQLFLKALGI